MAKFEAFASYTDCDGDELQVGDNHAASPELYFRFVTEATGVALTKEQALQLAEKIQKFYKGE